MTTVDTTPTPKTGNTSPLIRQQAIESALSDALHLVRTHWHPARHSRSHKPGHPGRIHAETGLR